MRQFDDKEHAKTRNPERPDDATALALPMRVRAALFQGWGPKLMLAALAVSALCAPAKAQQVSYIPLSAAGVSQDAPDRLAAIQIAYDYAESVIQAGCTAGTIENEREFIVYAFPNAFGWSAKVVITAACVLGD